MKKIYTIASIVIVLCVVGGSIFFSNYKNTTTPPIISGEISTILKQDNRLPNLPQFRLISSQPLDKNLRCVENEIERSPEIYVCTDSAFEEMSSLYSQFRNYLLQKDMENAWKIGKKLGPYLFGFNGDKYRIFENSLVTITFGPQSWGDVAFNTYTDIDGEIVRQIFISQDSDYSKWENAIIEKFQLKSFDDLYDGSVPFDSEKRNNINQYSDKYWYDILLKTPLQ